MLFASISAGSTSQAASPPVESLAQSNFALVHCSPNACIGADYLKNKQHIHYFEDSSVVVVCDAFLSNVDELNALNKGQAVPQHLDKTNQAQLIANAFHAYGKVFAKYLLGDFAIILWDKTTKQLLVARDSFGNRPLFYYHHNQQLLIASRISSIQLCLPFQLTFNHQQSIAVALGNHISQPETTFYRKVYSFLPNHTTTITNGSMTAERYWLPDMTARLTYSGDEQAIEALQELLINTVRSYTRPPFKSGFLLSGGLDSSALVSLALHNAPNDCSERIAVFTNTDYKSSVNSDSEYINLYSQHSELDLSVIEPINSGPFADIEELLSKAETPLLASNAYQYQALWRAAEQSNVDLMIDGAFGELGPSHHARLFIIEQLINGQWSRAFKEIQARKQLTGWSLLGVLRHELLAPLMPKPSTASSWSDLLQAGYLKQAMPRATTPTKQQKTFSVREAQYQGIVNSPKTSHHYNCFGSNNQIRRVYPYLDKNIIDFCLAADASLKFRSGYNRYLIRAATRGVMPDAIRRRLSKAPFAPHHQQLLRHQKAKVLAFLKAIHAKDPVQEVVNIDLLIQCSQLKSPRCSNIFISGVYLILFLKQFAEFKTSKSPSRLSEAQGIV